MFLYRTLWMYDVDELCSDGCCLLMALLAAVTMCLLIRRSGVRANYMLHLGYKTTQQQKIEIDTWFGWNTLLLFFA